MSRLTLEKNASAFAAFLRDAGMDVEPSDDPAVVAVRVDELGVAADVAAELRRRGVRAEAAALPGSSPQLWFSVGPEDDTIALADRAAHLATAFAEVCASRDGSRGPSRRRGRPRRVLGLGVEDGRRANGATMRA
jgi:hypothetical protein